MANGKFLDMDKVVLKPVRECFTFMSYKIQMEGITSTNNYNTQEDDL